MEETNSVNNAGMSPNIAATLAYVLGIVTGLIFYLISKDKYVRFHALQSILAFAALAILHYLAFYMPIFGSLLGWLISLITFVLWIVLMVKAYGGERFKLPIIGDIAEKNS